MASSRILYASTDGHQIDLHRDNETVWLAFRGKRFSGMVNLLTICRVGSHVHSAIDEVLEHLKLEPPHIRQDSNAKQSD